MANLTLARIEEVDDFDGRLLIVEIDESDIMK